MALFNMKTRKSGKDKRIVRAQTIEFRVSEDPVCRCGSSFYKNNKGWKQMQYNLYVCKHCGMSISFCDMW